MSSRIVTFPISVTGSVTKEKFDGVFEVKLFMSHRDVMREDEVRRSYLGKNPGEASEYSQAIAQAIAFLTVRVAKCPAWFLATNYGADLLDENVLVEVHSATHRVIGEALAEINKQAEEAKAALAKIADIPAA